MNEPQEIQPLLESVRSSAKYASIDPGLIQSLIIQEMAKGRNARETVKAVRNKLHQIGSAYQEKPILYDKLAERLTVLPHDTHSPEIRAFSLEAMSGHTSTRERLGFLDSFYRDTLVDIGPITSLLDLACGLNPLALAWMPLAAEARIEVCDIYADMVRFLNTFFDHTGVNGRAYTCDLTHGVPSGSFNLVLLLKTIPCLEQVDRTIGKRLLTSLQAEHILVSFPVRSLGGRSKGMRENYDQHFQQLISGLAWRVTRFDFPGELVFRLSRL